MEYINRTQQKSSQDLRLASFRLLRSTLESPLKILVGAMQHSLDYLREALQLWLSVGEKINYSAQDNDILTAIGFRPDALRAMIIVKNSRLDRA